MKRHVKALLLNSVILTALCSNNWDHPQIVHGAEENISSTHTWHQDSNEFSETPIQGTVASAKSGEATSSETNILKKATTTKKSQVLSPNTEIPVKNNVPSKAQSTRDDTIPPSGTYTFSKETSVYAEPSLSASIVASYAPGESVTYTGVKENEGHLWLVYTGASGATRYVPVEKVPTVDPVPDSTIPSSGTWTFATSADVKSAPSPSAETVATYAPGESVVYTSTTIAEGFVWLVYTGGSGATRYVAVKESNDSSVTPKPSSKTWPFDKAFSGTFEDGQQFGKTSFNRGGSPDSFFHDGFDFGSAIYGSGSTIKSISDGKVIYAGLYGHGLGTVIVVDAGDGHQIMYQEFSENTADILVKLGDTVTAGTAIGKLSGTHLHVGVTSQNWESSLAFAFNPSGPWIDPIKYIQSDLK